MGTTHQEQRTCVLILKTVSWCFNGAWIVLQSIARPVGWAHETGIKGSYEPLLKSSKTV